MIAPVLLWGMIVNGLLISGEDAQTFSLSLHVTTPLNSKSNLPSLMLKQFWWMLTHTWSN